MKFGEFVAVDHVSFCIRSGEIFGFIGSNGCGKSTTMKMLTGLLPATEGTASLFGNPVDPHDINTRRRVGYMSQSFSLYSELTLRQNLVLHARLFGVAEPEIPKRVEQLAQRFGISDDLESMPDKLTLGSRQRLSLAAAMIHKPELLILDEPTSGVDPISRDRLWQLMIDLARDDKVTIFISTHFMNEAARCDRISLMHSGRVLVIGTPKELVAERGVQNLEQVFIDYLKEADETKEASAGEASEAPASNGDSTAVEATAIREAAAPASQGSAAQKVSRTFSFGRAWSYSLREARELQRDPLRATMALLGTFILMLVVGLGINLDVENLNYAVLDYDQTLLSHNYALNLSGSRYFLEQPPILNYADLDARMSSGELALAIEIPPGFAREVARGNPVEIAGWVDGAMPQRAETAQAYVLGMHQGWLVNMARERLGHSDMVGSASVETRFRYNPDVRSLPAMVPAVIPLLLLMIPAMLAALSVVREKELGSIVNLYVTPVTRSEFLLGKQFPYIVLGVVNFLLIIVQAIVFFDVPIKGSFPALACAAVIYVVFATGFGLFASTFTRSQIAAIFVIMIGTMIPAIQFAMLAAPTTHFVSLGQAVLFRGAEIKVVWPQFLALFAIGSGFFTISLYRFRIAITQMA